MTSESIRRSECDSEKLLAVLTARQHLHPHRKIWSVLGELCNATGACPAAAARAAEWLELPRDLAIGRLRRTELTQLSRAIHRFWQAALRAS